MKALKGIRVCDFTGQLAGAAATKWLAAFGAEVIRIEDPTNNGAWDVLRNAQPFVDERRGPDLGGGFNNHNVGKLGITLNLKSARGKEILEQIIAKSDIVTENFANGVLERLGFGYERLKQIKPDIIYVSNCGFGNSGPYQDFKTWGPIVQAVSGLTFNSGLPEKEPAGWGFSYMDHTGAMYMAIAALMAIYHRMRTGEGQWVDMACCDSALSLNGLHVLDYTVNGRPARREGHPIGSRSEWPAMAPHGIYPTQGDDQWVAIACRNDEDWQALAGVIAQDWASDPALLSLQGRLADQDRLDNHLETWCRKTDKHALQHRLQSAGIAAAAVLDARERIEGDMSSAAFNLWPTVTHSAMGDVRVDGLPVRFSRTPHEISQGAPCVGEHTEKVLASLLGIQKPEVDALREEGVV
ncbi:MAG: CoA transferase [Sphingomonadaceae bacterium]|nr:CoA transferase [Sphingomonadaceae bacterium]